MVFFSKYKKKKKNHKMEILNMALFYRVFFLNILLQLKMLNENAT